MPGTTSGTLPFAHSGQEVNCYVKFLTFSDCLLLQPNLVILSDIFANDFSGFLNLNLVNTVLLCKLFIMVNILSFQTFNSSK